MHQAVVLRTTGERFSAVLADVSETGAHAKVSGALTVGEPISVCWPDGRTVAARVAWASNGACGFAFDEPQAARAA